MAAIIVALVTVVVVAIVLASAAWLGARMTADRAAITRLIAEIGDALHDVPRNDEDKLQRARTLAAEAWRTPPGAHRDELVRDARALLRQGRRR